MFGWIGGRPARLGVNNTSFKLIMVMILISWALPSSANSICEKTMKGVRKAEEYEDGTLPFIKIGGCSQVTLPVCRIKDTYSCLILTGNKDDIPGGIELVKKMIYTGLEELPNGDGCPPPNTNARSALDSLPMKEKEFVEVYLDLSRHLCVSGVC